jgi:23S rRNA (cytidine1920-2'-O)/16S rRNA (cytidine1409-2'-O)-methyltransferase
MNTTRLDKLLLEKGLVTSRHKAEMLISDGGVQVDGTLITKPGKKFNPEAEIVLLKEPMPWVSRGAYKLLAALDAWNVEVQGKNCLDIGASTGGFTQVLLSRGSIHVTAIDTGTNQLDDSLRHHPDILCLENQNFRHLSPEDLPHRYEIAVMDLSFISLKLILPLVPAFLTPTAQVIALVKPQFEVGKENLGRGGIVRNERHRIKALEGVKQCALDLGFILEGKIDSPISGGDGNHEYLIQLRWKI